MAGSKLELQIKASTRVSTNLKLKCIHHERSSVEVEDRVFPDTGGGFSYERSTKLTGNRQISWKIIENVVNLEESSQNFNLYGNKVQVTIADEVILPNVIIHETADEVFVFIATPKSIHQLAFSHPTHKKYGFILPSGMDVSLPSIFHNAHENTSHIQAALNQPCHSFDVAITNTGDIYFGLVTDVLTLLMVNLQPEPGACHYVELKETSFAQRLWTGLVPSFVRGDSSSWMGVESLVLHTFGHDDVFAFTFCKDLKIRVWSIKTQTCIETKDLVPLIPDKLDLQPDMVGSLSLKKAKSNTPSQLIIAAHCCLMYSSQFIIMEIFKEKTGIAMMHVSNFFSDFTNIQDLCVTNQYIWALWCGSEDNEHTVSYAPIEGGTDYERGWHKVHLKPVEREDLYMPVYLDTKEIFVEKIFSLGFYNKEAILKALKVFVKPTGDGHEFLPEDSCELNALKESVYNILDLEVERNTINRDLELAEYQEITTHCWSRFHSLVLQCRQASEKPLGLHISENAGTGFVIRKESIGFITNLDWIDHLYISNLDTCEGVLAYIDKELNLNGDAVTQDLFFMFECMKTIPEQFNGDVILGIDKDLDGNEDVKSFLANMASTLITNTSDFEQLVGDTVERGDYLCRMEARLRHIRDPKKAVELILTTIEINDVLETSILERSDNISTPIGEEMNQSFCSCDGVSLVSQFLISTARHRMHLCRDLYILLKFMSLMGCKVGLELSVSRDFDTITASSCYELLRAYHAVVWSASTPFDDVAPAVVDNNITNLASLHLTERSPASRTARKTDDNVLGEVASALSCFVKDIGVQTALIQYNQTRALKTGLSTFPEVLHFVGRSCFNQLWVLNEKGSDFPEYLAAHGQYSILNEYLHFCDEWCLVNRGTKDFLMAQSYLSCDEPHKALKCFISAARGISLKERLLMNLLEREDDEGEDMGKQEALVQYFVKVMRLFEQYNYPDSVISAASSALTIAKKDDRHIPMLWSVVFKYHLELEHHQEAYSSIVHNPDKSRRQDCLRHFIVTLCDRGMFQEICTYPYVNLEEEVVSIIEARARTMDITVNRFYDLLYSYHTIKHDYRKAATTMYEQACRLSTEMHGLKSLQKQAKCYLASITTLQLVDEKYAWIVRPQEKTSTISSVKDSSSRGNYSQSPKRREDGEQIFYSTVKNTKRMCTVIVELNDIEKEYLLVLARLKLVQHGKNETVAVGPTMSAPETIGLLSQLGLYDVAFSVALKFKLSLKTIFETLVYKCANLVKYKPSEFDERWNWLTLNEINSTQIVTSKSAMQQALYLLQRYLTKFQEKNSSANWKVVARKFLSCGCALPAWLIKEYERINPAELLHLYICFGMVNEATELAINYIDAVLGRGKEQFGLNTALHATTPPVWLPYTLFDQLLSPLRSSNDNPELTKLCTQLEGKLNDYFNQLEITTCDKLDYVNRRESRMS